MSEWPDMLIGAAARVIRVKDGNISTFAEGNGLYYGITWTKDAVYILERGYHPNDERRTKPERIRRFPGDVLGHTGNWDGHQILAHNNRMLYITVSASNRFDIIDLQHDTVHEWNYTEHEGRDVNHINSVWIDASIWVCEHNWKNPSVIREFSLDRARQLRAVQVGNQIHNVYIENGMLYTCSSKDGTFLEYDLGSGRISRSVSVTGTPKGARWTRGLARTSDAFYVGVSALATREQRRSGTAWVLKINNDMKIVDALELPNAGQLCEVRVTSETDRAHNRIAYPNVEAE